MSDSSISVQAHNPADPSYEKNFDVLDLWNTLLSYRKLILAVTLLGSFLTVVITVNMKKVYEVEATFLPLTSSSLPNIGNLSNIAALAGISLGSSGSKGIDFEVLLKSRSFNEDIVRDLDLLPVLFKDSYNPRTGALIEEEQSLRAKIIQSIVTFFKSSSQSPNEPISAELKQQYTLSRATMMIQNSVINVSKEPGSELFSIKVTWDEPQLAAKIANQYLTNLEKFLFQNTLTTAKKSRIFIENQMQKTEQTLNQSEEAIKAFSQKHGIFEVADQASMLASSIGKMRGEIALQEVQLMVLREFHGESSPQVAFEKARLLALREQLLKLENGTVQTSDSTQKDYNLSLNQLPSLGLEFARLKREMNIQQEIYKLLRTELETTKIKESRELDSIQIVDRAIPTEFPAKPDKKMIVVLGFVSSVMLAIFAVFFIELLKKLIYENQFRKESQ
ncbi:GNVR domain-containing protein [Deltaproteobacteria bacterium TL4]